MCYDSSLLPLWWDYVACGRRATAYKNVITILYDIKFFPLFSKISKLIAQEKLAQKNCLHKI
jgi:hypothetical protein